MSGGTSTVILSWRCQNRHIQNLKKQTIGKNRHTPGNCNLKINFFVKKCLKLSLTQFKIASCFKKSVDALKPHDFIKLDIKNRSEVRFQRFCAKISQLEIF